MRSAFRHLAFGSIACALSACAHEPGPEEVAAAYREAWRRADTARLLALSSESFRHRVSHERLTEALSAHGLTATGTVTLEALTLRYSDGLELELIREAGAWRVAAGGPDPDRLAQPLAALRRFLSAAVVEDLEAVRGFIPRAARDRYTRDADLLEHLRRHGDRVREVLRALSSGRPEVRETEGGAEVRYAPGRAVRMRTEEGAWCVLDLE